MTAKFGLYVILTDPAAGYRKCTEAAVEAGIRFLQLRMKKSSREEIIKTALMMEKITRGTATNLIINDDVTIAMEVDADGVHLGQDDMSLSEAEKLWKTEGKIYGLSTHNIKQVKKAVDQNPDYIGVGPVFPTPTKIIPDPDLGLEYMESMIKNASVPAVAIGGINRQNLLTVLEHGAVNFSAVRDIMTSHDPLSVIREFQNIWNEFFRESKI